MTSITQEYPISAENLDEKWEGLYRVFDDCPKTNKKFDENHQLLLRLRRAISWLDMAQQVERGIEDKENEKNLSARFIFFWIGFNALYGKKYEVSCKKQEHIELIKKYFNDIDEDVQSRTYDVIKIRNNSGPIKNLTKNRFIWPEFWKKIRQGCQRDEIRKMWEKELLSEIKKEDTIEILLCVFECLCVLRNQVMHGGSTRDSKLGRKQLQTGIKIMEILLPVFTDIEESDKTSPPEKKKTFLKCATSWWDIAKQLKEGREKINKDVNTQLIFLWISFNAIYARNEGNYSEKERIRQYFEKLLECNEVKSTIYNAINNDTLKDIEFLYEELGITFPGWNIESTKDILCDIFQHLCELRGRLVHGYEVWDSENKKMQLGYKIKIMHQILPVLIDIMLKIPKKEWKEWDKIWYPRVLGARIKGKHRKKRDVVNYLDSAPI